MGVPFESESPWHSNPTPRPAFAIAKSLKRLANNERFIGTGREPLRSPSISRNSSIK